MKNNIIREFLKRGVSLLVVPYDYDLDQADSFDGVFVSNGPGSFFLLPFLTFEFEKC